MKSKLHVFRVIEVLAILLFLQSSFAAARDKNQASDQQNATPVFKSRSQMVLVPVVVKGPHGDHVSGLTKNDFVIRDNGAPQRLVSCEEITTSTQQVHHVANASSKADRTTFSNVQVEATPRRIEILALDAINTPIALQTTARKQLIKYLSESLDPNSLISLIVVRRGGVKVIHDFTTNPSVLIAALKKVRGVQSDVETIQQVAPADDPVFQEEVTDLNEFENGEADNAAQEKRITILSTIDALRQIAASYAGVPGRKALIWMTAGFPFSISDSDSMITGRLSNSVGIEDIQPEYEDMWARFNDANIAIYPVDVRGLENPTTMDVSIGKTPPRAYATRQMLQHEDSLDTFRSFADMTGGKAYFNTNDLAKSFREASQDSSSYYMLAFYLDRNAAPGWHKLKVDLHRSGTTVRARNGFFVYDSSDPKLRKNEVEEALTSPMDFTGIPLTLEWNSRLHVDKSATTKISFDIVLPPNALDVDDMDKNHVSFDVLAIAKLPDGTVGKDLARNVDAHLKQETADKLRSKGMTYHGALDLTKGSYTFRIVVRDNLSGRVGSVSAPLEIE